MYTSGDEQRSSGCPVLSLHVSCDDYLKSRPTCEVPPEEVKEGVIWGTGAHTDDVLCRSEGFRVAMARSPQRCIEQEHAVTSWLVLRMLLVAIVSRFSWVMLEYLPVIPTVAQRTMIRHRLQRDTMPPEEV